MAKQEQRAILSNAEGLLKHALDCSDPRCILPTCVNTKLMLRHSQGCQKVNTCTICLKMKSLVLKHTESCVDIHCQIPFCCQARLDTIKRAQIHLGDSFGVALNTDYGSLAEIPQMQRDNVDIARPQSCPQSFDNNLESKSTRRRAISNPTTPSCVQHAISILSDYPPVPFNEMVDHSEQFETTSSFPNLSQSCPEQLKDQSSINAANDMANLPCCSFVGPFPASSESTLKTATMATASPSFVVETREWGNTSATNDSVVSAASSPSAPGQGQNVVRFHMGQSNNEIHRLTDHLNTSHLSSRESKASHSAPQAKYVSLGDGVVPRDIKTNNTRSQLKARLIQALYGILRLLMQSKSTEEQWTCIRLLTGVLYEIKKSNAVIRTPSAK